MDRVAKRRDLRIAAIAMVLVVGLAAQSHVALADNGESPGGDGSLLDSLVNQSDSTPGAAQDIAKAAGSSSDSNSVSASGTTGAAANVVGTAVIPPATPLIVDSYTTDPAQLQSGTRFRLGLKLRDPGSDAAQDVVVQIGPSSDSGWGSSAEIAVLGSGSATYVGPIAAGGTNDQASFQLIANPASPGGLRTVPVKITWKTNGYEHTASEAVGLLVNSFVALDATFHTTAVPVQKEPFTVALKVKNTTSRTVKGVSVVFSGKGARPSSQGTMTIGDIEPGRTRSVSTTFTAPLVGRARLIADVGYVDDFGDQRTVRVQGWAHVERTAPAASSDDSLSRHVVLVIAALLGLSG